MNRFHIKHENPVVEIIKPSPYKQIFRRRNRVIAVIELIEPSSHNFEPNLTVVIRILEIIRYWSDLDINIVNHS